MSATTRIRSAIAAALLPIAFLGFAPSTLAQSTKPPLPAPVARATRIATADAPTIDGDLSDAVWLRATVLDAFAQAEPNEGAPASERTEVRILYDENTLYFAIMAHDRHPPTAKVKQRDGDFGGDDSVRIYLDPGCSRRNAYVFDVTPLGARAERLLQNNDTILTEWNTLWTARVRIVPEGWAVEIAIPFRSIGYRDGENWGFDIGRTIRTTNERIRWANPSKILSSSNITREGTLTGISGVRPGLGLDVQTFALLQYYKNDTGGAGTGVSFRPSGNIYYKITPSLTGTLTYNPDFSDAPLDQRKINISRFSLFYPEQRDFFLQDASAFEFGGLGLSVNQDPNGAPFFSRRIGIADGKAVNILGGAKLSGEYDGVGIGAISVRTAASGETGEQQLSLLRATVPVLEDSKLGLIYTNGDPTGAAHNQVAGGDFQFRTAHLAGDKILQADAYFERSFSTRSGNDDSFGVNLNFPNEPWNSYFRFKQVGTHFDPALGFVSRTGIRDYQGNVALRTRFDDSAIRWWQVGPWYEVITDLRGDVVSHTIDVWTDISTEHGDYALIEAWSDYEKVDCDFTLPRGVPVAVGQYTLNVAHAYLSSASDRLIYTNLDVQYGSFYGGTLLQTDATVNIRPNDSLVFSVRHILQDITVPAGSVTGHVFSLDNAVYFTANSLLRAQVQYDTISKRLETSVRYAWEIEPGTQLVMVWGHEGIVRYGARTSLHDSSRDTRLSIRLGKTFRL